MIAALALIGCIRPPRERASEGVDHGYPSCGQGALPEGERIATGFLRAGPVMSSPSVVERFEVRRRDCLEVFSGRQDWALSSIDLEVVYDAETLLPLRVWKRIGSPGLRGGAPRVDVRRFELRDTDRVALTQRRVDGELEHWRIRGPIPRVIIGPGRGVLTMWIRRARLPVGGRLRETALDVRESMELIRDVTLLRLEDRDDPTIGRRVRVYSIYGREPFYADENDVVIGDMMGMLPGELVRDPMPTPSVVLDPPDPIGTP
ncbi:MAG: hypothetical protein M3Y87_20215 [Myxococcota bacterium]|nr:hypothetical protein [Myxococcota bacterium]